MSTTVLLVLASPAAGISNTTETPAATRAWRN